MPFVPFDPSRPANGQAQCPFPPGVPAPAQKEAPCAPPNVLGLSSTQAILALEPCFAVIGKAHRAGYHLSGDQVAILFSTFLAQDISITGTQAVFESLAKIVDKGGNTGGAPLAVGAGWSVLQPLLARPLERVLDLLAARAVLEYVSHQSCSFSRHTAQNLGVTTHGSLGAGI